jgi:general secretion pathway protein M
MALKLNKRERYAVILAGAVIGLFLVLQLVVFPFMESMDRQKRILTVQSEALNEIKRLKAEYESVKGQADRSKRIISQRQSGFTLFSYMDRLAGETGLKENIAYMKPSTAAQDNSPFKLSIVETKLQSVTMEQLTEYIYKIETSPNMVRLKRLSITRTGKEQAYLDAVLLAEAYQI